MQRTLSITPALAALAAVLLVACGGNSSGTPTDGGAGGAKGTGGRPGTGGDGTGGADVGSGGVGTGGATGLGGATAVGGAGGSSAASGGSGTASGGSSGLGGTTASGGRGTGGAATSGGNGGTGTGGAGMGGASSGVDAGAPDAAPDAPIGTPDTGTPSPDVASSDGPLASGAVDIVFMVDDSTSMAPLQASLARAFAGFMNTLEGLPGGLPSLHIGVISSSLGAGLFGNVSGCTPGSAGNLNGAFIHPSTCTALPADQRFLIADGSQKNFTGDISDVFGCLAMTGAAGCGFEHQFEATHLALQKAMLPNDADNSGFLRANAHLAIIMLTNEDDCSVPADSMLFDPNQQMLSDPLGGLQSYRCNEFGHRCDGVAPPHIAPPVAVTLNNCVPAEAQGRLTLVSDFIAFVRGLKTSSDKIFVAAMAGPVTPYVVEAKSFMLGNGSTEIQPTIQHACSNPSGTYADPAVRVKTWVDAFGANGVFESLCPDDLGPPMMRIAQALATAIRR